MSSKSVKWTEESIYKEALKYRSKPEFKKKCPQAYNRAYKLRIQDKAFCHMTVSRETWTVEKIQQEASKYTTRSEFQKHSLRAYTAAHKRKILDEVCLHMESPYQSWTIEKIKQIAISKNGICKSSEYKGCYTKLLFQCNECGHEWWLKPTYLIHGNNWCPECNGNPIYSINDFHELARLKGGFFLSEKYVDSYSKLEFKCANGHTFSKRPGDIVNKDGWCPYCPKGITEEKCRFIFEEIFQLKFRRNRKILEGLELDGYNSPLKLAFEYHGEQHYYFIKYFHRNKKGFERRKELDLIKVKKCLELGIRLVVIPYYKAQDKNTLVDFIVSELKTLGYEIDFDKAKFSFKYFKPHISILEKIKKVAVSKGGECLDEEYFDSNTKMQFKCSCREVWETTADKILNAGSWCHQCGGSKKGSINEFRKLIESKGGICVGTEYVNGRTKIPVLCEEGHSFEIRPSDVKAGYWCMKCSIKRRSDKRRGSIDELKKLAKKNGGKCLSNIYIGTHDKYLWKCKCGYEWSASASSVKSGSWCKICRKKKASKKMQFGLDHVQQYAKEKGGVCTSTDYKNNKTHLELKCKNGHTWTDTVNNMIRKSKWCKECEKGG
jgi:hypothetical protein